LSLFKIESGLFPLNFRWIFKKVCNIARCKKSKRLYSYCPRYGHKYLVSQKM